MWGRIFPTPHLVWKPFAPEIPQVITPLRPERSEAQDVVCPDFARPATHLCTARTIMYDPYMTTPGKGARFALGPPYDAMLADLCEAKDDASAVSVMRRALVAYVESECEQNEGMRRRYEDLQKRRRGEDGKVKPIRPVS